MSQNQLGKNLRLDDGVERTVIPADPAAPSVTGVDPANSNSDETSHSMISPQLAFEIQCGEDVTAAVDKLGDGDTGSLGPIQYICKNVLSRCQGTRVCKMATAMRRIPKEGYLMPAPPPTSRIPTPARASAPRNSSTTSNASPGVNSPNGTTGSSDDNSSESDRQYCQSLQQAATRCCMDPSQCGGTPPLQIDKSASSSDLSFPDLCGKMNSAGTAEATSSLNAGNLCLQKYSACQEQCNSMANNYSGSVADGFRASAHACTALSSRAVALNQNAKASNTAANSGQNCDGLTQAMAQGLNAFGGAGRDTKSAALNRPGADAPQVFKGNNNDPYGCASNPGSSACQSCSHNPGLPACRALASANAIAEGKTGYQQPTKDQNNQDKFNVGGTTDGVGSTPAFGKFEPKANTVNTVANNSGGGIPGSDNGGKGASLGAGAGKAAATAAAGYTTDIDQGTRSGGGYSNPVGGTESADNSDSAGFKGYGGHEREPASATSVDLKKYLPGGERDPGHNIAGLRGRNGEINGPSVDIWTKISARYQVMCQLGELFDCR